MPAPILSFAFDREVMVMMLARVFLAADIERDESESIDQSLAAFVYREQTDSEEGAKDPDDANHDPACCTVSCLWRTSALILGRANLPVKNFLLKMYPVPYIAAVSR